MMPHASAYPEMTRHFFRYFLLRCSAFFRVLHLPVVAIASQAPFASSADIRRMPPSDKNESFSDSYTNAR